MLLRVLTTLVMITPISGRRPHQYRFARPELRISRLVAIPCVTPPARRPALRSLLTRWVGRSHRVNGSFVGVALSSLSWGNHQVTTTRRFPGISRITSTWRWSSARWRRDDEMPLSIKAISEAEYGTLGDHPLVRVGYPASALSQPVVRVYGLKRPQGDKSLACLSVACPMG